MLQFIIGWQIGAFSTKIDYTVYYILLEMFYIGYKVKNLGLMVLRLARAGSNESKKHKCD